MGVYLEKHSKQGYDRDADFNPCFLHSNEFLEI